MIYFGGIWYHLAKAKHIILLSLQFFNWQINLFLKLAVSTPELDFYYLFEKLNNYVQIDALVMVHNIYILNDS